MLRQRNIVVSISSPSPGNKVIIWEEGLNIVHSLKRERSIISYPNHERFMWLNKFPTIGVLFLQTEMSTETVNNVWEMTKQTKIECVES